MTRGSLAKRVLDVWRVHNDIHLQRADAEVERLYMPLMVKHGMKEDRIRQLSQETLARFLELAGSPQKN